MTTIPSGIQDTRVMVTGATDGIGKATALELATMGLHVIIVGRNPSKIAATIDQIKQVSGNNRIDALQADFASLAQVRQLAATFAERYDYLDVLINNAGAFFSSRGETADGYEQTLGVNHLAPFLLTNLLLDALRAGARRTGASRIVNVSSAVHMINRLNFNDLQNRRRYSGMRAYAQSKLANLLFTYELARRLTGSGMSVNALHPGIVASNFARGQSGLMAALVKLGTASGIVTTDGARTSIYLATSPEVAGVTGKYFVRSQPARSSSASYDTAAAARLWQVSAELTGLAAVA